MVTNPLTISVGVLTTIFWHTPIIFLIFSIIYSTVITWTVGGIALKKCELAREKSDLKKIGIFTLVGNNPLAGFLMLIIKDEQIEKYRQQKIEEQKHKLQSENKQ